MANSKDYQQIYDRYQTEGLPKQISIVKFCEQNGVPYKQYERWYKTSRGGRPVQVELIDSDEEKSQACLSYAEAQPAIAKQ